MRARRPVHPRRAGLVAAGLLLAAGLAAASAQAPAPAPQHPSPMSDTTRPHPRVVASPPRGTRQPVRGGTLFLPDGLRGGRLPLVIHFHGAPWLIERHVASGRPRAALLTFDLGSGSAVYGRAFATPDEFPALLEEARTAAATRLGRPVSFHPVVLTSFSAGYGAVRAILRTPAAYDRVSSVVLADSLHADYVGDAGTARSADLPVDEADLDVFLRLAADAAAGRKRFLVTHSEVYPGTYASTTETADALLRAAGVARARQLREGPIGMQQLSATGRGRFRVLGFAGNSAPDHLDHLYALGAWLPDAIAR
ncbi:MAG: hypothetical protein AB7O28_26805 [Vicinamibacterales bacterium]